MARRSTFRPSAPSMEELKSAFLSTEEREVREGLKKEIMESVRVCREMMTALVLANHTGEKMDVISDMLTRSSKFGSLTQKQHDYAASIIIKSHLDALLVILAKADGGEDTVAQPEVVRMEEKVESRKAKLEISVTESNPNYGIF